MNKLRLRDLNQQFGKLIFLFSGKAARQGYLSAIDQSIISFSNFVATIILARNASPTELGVYGVGFTALRLVRAIQDGIIIQPLNTFGAGLLNSKWREYFSSTGIFQIGLAIVLAVCAAITGWYLTESGNDTAGPAVFSLWSAFLFWQFFEFIRRTLYTRTSVQYAVVMSTLSNLARISFMVWLLIQDNLSGTSSIVAISIGSLIGIIPGILKTKKYWILHELRLRETWNKNWRFGKWILGSSTANWLALEFYPVMAAGLINFAAAGAYRAIQNLVAPIHVLLRATDTFLTPRAAKIFEQSRLSGLNHIIRITYSILSVPVFGVLLIALLFPEQLLSLFYGDTYIQFSNGIILMALSYVFLFGYSPVVTGLKAVRIGQPIFIASVAAIAAMFTVGILLVIKWGVYGTLAGQALNSFLILAILWVSWYTIRKRLNNQD
jgi:O-antigen/teichoic acid export membrane protein